MKNPTLIQFALAIALLAALAGVYAFALSKTKELSAKSGELAAELAKKSDARSGASVSRTALSELALDEAVMRERFVSEGDVVSFLETLEALAEELGASASVVAVSDPDALGRIEIVLTVTGSFDSVMRTVGAIEYGPYGSATENIALDAGDERTWRAALTFVVVAPPTPR